MIDDQKTRATARHRSQTEVDRDALMDDVLSVEKPDAATLRALVARYPDDALEIVDFFIEEILHPGPPVYARTPKTDQEDDVALQHGMSLYTLVTHRHGSLTDADGEGEAAVVRLARADPQRREEIARQAGLSATLVGRILDRRIAPFSIPQEAIARLSRALGIGEDVLFSALLWMPAPSSTALPHLKDFTPRNDFFDAIRDDPTVTPTQRARWLAWRRDTDREDPYGR